MSKLLTALLTDAVNAGFTITVGYQDECDYIGTNVADAVEALEACDEMELRLDDSPEHGDCWADIINGLDGIEVLADFSGAWINRWYEENKFDHGY